MLRLDDTDELTCCIPVLDKHGDVLLYDIYIDGEWHGSRRKLEWCQAYIDWRKP